MRLYGGMCFAAKKLHDDIWKNFPDVGFWLPQIEATQENGKTEIVVYDLNTQPEFAAALKTDENIPDVIESNEVPEFPVWQQSVDKVLQ